MRAASILIVGVGGQGTLLASRIIGDTALKNGLDVKISEVHGMSQRGGGVVTHVKYGGKVFSPLIEEGEADYIIAFEQMEGLKWLPYLKKGGIIIINKQRINPMPVITGKAEYPENITKKMKKQGVNLIEINGLKFAEESGSIKAVNTVLLGSLSRIIKTEKQAWIDALKMNIPEKLFEINLKAFDNGYNSDIGNN